MEWSQITDQNRRCLKWIPRVYENHLKAAAELGEKAKTANQAFREAKQKREKPAKLKTLKAATNKAWAALAKGENLAIVKGVYIIQDASGFSVLHLKTGSKRHSTHPDLKKAQAAALKLLK